MDDVPLLTYHDGSTLRVTVLNTKHTIGSLAKATGYTKAHISRVFRLIDGPSDECLERCAKALRVSKEDLRARLRRSRRDEGIERRAKLRAVREAS